MPYEKQKKWKWPEILPQEDKLHRRIRIHIEEEEECSVEEDGLMQSKSVNQHLKCRFSKWLPSRLPVIAVVESKMPNAITAVGMDIFTGNVPQHHDPQIEVAVSIVVDGIPEDVEEADEEEAEVVEEDHSQLEPLWLRRDQMHLGRICSKIQMLPQCPVLILQEQNRETS